MKSSSFIYAPYMPLIVSNSYIDLFGCGIIRKKYKSKRKLGPYINWNKFYTVNDYKKIIDLSKYVKKINSVKYIKEN